MVEWCFHLNTMFTIVLERMRRIKNFHLNLQKSQKSQADDQKQGQYHHRKLKKAELMAEASFIENKQTNR